MTELRGQTAFVTGGTGFIGGRLIESLVGDHGVKVKALVRNSEVGAGAFRAARSNVEFIHADITDENALADSLADCDFVFHCAFGSHGNLAEQQNVTVNGTAALLTAAEKSDHLTRFLNLSTATVFGTPIGESINETTTPNPSKKWHYARDKWEAEQRVAASKIPTTTLRLSSVYGPRSPAFTIYPIQELKTGRPVLVNGGTGNLNPIYIDDVIQAILLAAVRDEAVGQIFLLNGPEKNITRRQFYEKYQTMLGLENRLIDLSPQEIRAAIRHEKWSATKTLPRAAMSALKESLVFKSRLKNSHLGQLAQKFWKKQSQKTKAISENQNELPWHLPPDFMIDYFAAITAFDNTKAKKLLGFSPNFSFEKGMAFTEKWARWARLLD